MNKKLSRLFSPGMTIYFVILAVFCLIGWIALPKPVAVIETAAVAGVLIYYLVRGRNQRKKLTQYLQDANFSVDSVSNERMRLPLPALILNISGGEIMWCNEAFMKICNAEESLFEEQISTLAPEMHLDWLFLKKCAHRSVVCVRLQLTHRMVFPSSRQLKDSCRKQLTSYSVSASSQFSHRTVSTLQKTACRFR